MVLESIEMRKEAKIYINLFFDLGFSDVLEGHAAPGVQLPHAGPVFE
jgi:hypothetical protein